MWLVLGAHPDQRMTTTLSGRGSGYVSTGAPPLRHSVSFSCLPRGNRDRPHRSRTATLPSDTDYGFVRAPPAVRLSVKYGVMLEEDSSEAQYRIPVKKESFRENLVKKSVSILSPTAWWSNKPRRNRNEEIILEEEEDTVQQRRWRSLGALLRLPNTSNGVPQASSPRAQSFYLLDDFLPRPSNSRRNHSGATTSSSDSLELSSPLSPPVPPPPPPPLRLIGFKDCSCGHCRQHIAGGIEDRLCSNDTVVITCLTTLT
ncbi:hypothetical protein RUM43_008595 [Polyplax serrata]|uniref:Uncharacterized protein n=1 Tax=Polyplax serrata TaxID=468196 RepID=A0AAN8NUJ1_POLSC